MPIMTDINMTMMVAISQAAAGEFNQNGRKTSGPRPASTIPPMMMPRVPMADPAEQLDLAPRTRP